MRLLALQGISLWRHYQPSREYGRIDRTVITTMAGDGLHATQEVSVVSNSAALT